MGIALPILGTIALAALSVGAAVHSDWRTRAIGMCLAVVALAAIWSRR
jgi:hypothetical protein